MDQRGVELEVRGAALTISPYAVRLGDATRIARAGVGSEAGEAASISTAGLVVPTG